MVNDTNIKNFINRYVIIHGRVGSIKSNTLFLSVNLDTNTEVIVKNFNQQAERGDCLKIIGKVASDLSIEFLDVYRIKDDFDLKLLNDAIPIIHHKEVFSMFY
jgi:hypothetical protein